MPTATTPLRLATIKSSLEKLIENKSVFLQEKSISLSSGNQSYDKFTGILRDLYADLYASVKDRTVLDDVLPTLYTDSEQGYDVDHVWEQMMLLQGPILEDLEEMLSSESSDENDFQVMEDDVESENDLTLQNESGSDAVSDSPEQEDNDDVEGLHSDSASTSSDSDAVEFEEEIDFNEPVDADNELGPSMKRVKQSKRKSPIDDDFFSLEDMEKFADMAERFDTKRARMDNDNQDDDGLSDDEESFKVPSEYFTNDPDELSDEETLLDEENEEDDNANNIMYEDFFGPRTPMTGGRERSFDRERDSSKEKESFGMAEDTIDDQENEELVDMDEDEDTQRQNKDLLGDYFHEDEVDDSNLSTFEKQQLKLQRMISSLESEAVAEKSWTLRGEVSSKARPVNSLLEEALEVDTASKPVPVITEETTRTLSEVIIQRIKDRAWDDVERKAPPENSIYDPNRRIELQDQKSGKSLAELYEEEFLQKKSTTHTSEKDTALTKEHEELTVMFTNICRQLDALSNYHFTPKVATADLEVIPAPNVPAISMEEAIPVHVSEATLATPGEVYKGGVKKSQEEMDASDKQRARRKAKRLAAKEKKAKEAAQALRQKTSTSSGSSTSTSAKLVQKEKEKAVQALKGQSNVTIISDGKKRTKELLSKNGGGLARVVQEGGSLGRKSKTVRAEMLKL